MAAFTTFSEEILSTYLKMFGKGRLIDYSPIPTGIDNSNYFVKLYDDGQAIEFVLTIMEGHSLDDAPFFANLLTHLHHYGLPVPAPQTTLDGMTSTIFCGKPTFLVKRLGGKHFRTTSIEQCHSIGNFLASQHKALGEFNSSRPNKYSQEWMESVLAEQEAKLSKEDHALLKATIEIYNQLNAEGLPKGIIHGDLFRDNALFFQNKLTGVIDYYRACEDLLAIDIAIAINDWCRDKGERVDETKRDAMLNGYNIVRPLTDAESRCMLDLQQISATRFALTRMQAGDPPLKDPEEMLVLARRFATAKR